METTLIIVWIGNGGLWFQLYAKTSRRYQDAPRNVKIGVALFCLVFWPILTINALTGWPKL